MGHLAAFHCQENFYITISESLWYVQYWYKRYFLVLNRHYDKTLTKMIMYSRSLILSQIALHKVQNRAVCSPNKNKNNIRFEIHISVTFCHTGNDTCLICFHSLVFQIQVLIPSQLKLLYTNVWEAMCWYLKVKIIISREALGSTPEGKPWWVVGLDDPI